MKKKMHDKIKMNFKNRKWYIIGVLLAGLISILLNSF